jgi:tryptophanyl-tRNA synthetase
MTTSRHLSLLKPTGAATLGSLLGALRPMAARQDGADCFYGVADLHALTLPLDPATLRRHVRELRTLFLACGLDAGATLFVQSDVPAHSELAYLLECVARTGELGRMIQYKEKGRGRESTRASLLTYPVLMAADILLYRTTEVPVGDDQRQHVELTRDLALRFNREHGEVFTVPRVVVAPVAARVMDLQDPTRKMSKSSRGDAGVVHLLDAPEVVARKVARAVTDGDTGPGAVRHDPAAKPGVSNLLEVLAACRGTGVDEAAKGVATYGRLKALVTEAVLAVLEPVRRRYDELAADPAQVDAVFAAGAERCRQETAPVLAAAREAMGLG